MKKNSYQKAFKLQPHKPTKWVIGVRKQKNLLIFYPLTVAVVPLAPLVAVPTPRPVVLHPVVVVLPRVVQFTIFQVIIITPPVVVVA